MKIDELTPGRTILQELGQRLARVRKQHGLTQTTLAEEAGIGIATLRRIEAGQDSQLETWIKLLKALGMTVSLDQFLPETFNSPMHEVLAGRQRRRPKQDLKDTIKWGDEIE